MTQVLPLSSPILPRFYYFINGIRANIADLVGGWQYRAARYVETETPYRADCYAYETRALTRWLFQPSRIAEASALLMQRSKIQEVKVLVGHSNGCDIICGMLKNYPMLRVGEVHLIAGAVEDSFEKNGLNQAIRNGQVGHVYLYCSHSDRALRFARLTHWVNWINRRWGYGDLGLVGPSDVAEDVKSCVSPLWFTGYDHGDYFSSKKCPTAGGLSCFEQTMRLILGL